MIDDGRWVGGWSVAPLGGWGLSVSAEHRDCSSNLGV